MRAALRPNYSTPWLPHPLHRQGYLPLHDLLRKICDITRSAPARALAGQRWPLDVCGLASSAGAGGRRGMKARALRMGLVGLLAVGMGLAWWSRNTWTAEAIVAWVEGLGVWGPLIFVGIYSLAPVLCVPGAVLTLAGGALFGPLAGALLSLVGATAGATVAFLLARFLAADWVERRLGKRLQAIKAGVEHEGWRFVAFVRLVPVFPFTLLNYALGLTRLSVRTYTITS